MSIDRRLRTATALLGAVALAAGLLASSAHGGSSTAVGLRARLAAPGGAAHALFIATLQGTSLRWSLAYERANGGTVAARVRVRGATRATTLCGSCTAL